ncbi:hypothetical protein GOP47_0009808 [Adiantum capillus-veneris]|uniref:WRKY domain-containing protein n=1 Tax=Adiantum capillus-veneris TaxID=13818 RepID=A0A9D4UYG4_ADICA|nr:hypothetical protein GOP47_0009808 [Adiantum capillus-veneris]
MLNFATPMDALLSQSSATLQTTAFTCMSTPLAEPSFCFPSALDLLSADNCSSSPASKKRKPNIPDLQAFQEQLLLGAHSGFMLMSDNHHNSSHTQSFPQWTNGDYSLIKAATHISHLPGNDHHVPMSATPNCHDLEDVLNFLWMDDDTASTAQSDASLRVSSDDQPFPSLKRDSLDWDYCSNESSSNLIGESRNEDPLGGELVEVGTASSRRDDKSHLASCLAGASWQQRTDVGASRQEVQSAVEGRQQRLLQGGVRASWQDGITRTAWQDGVRGGSWQDGGAKAIWQEVGARESWQRCKVAEGGDRASWQQAVTGGPAERASRSWAGPTLLDIESALALTDQSMSGPPTPSSTADSKQYIRPIATFLDVKALLSQGETPQYHQDSQSTTSAWRLKLQKRSSQEPKYTIRVESEEKALGDGYRWRKYGQKSIKNSPFPRSYYRCSTGKCSAKKQVEKCQEEEGLFLVTYEGIHLHHKPNMMHKFRMPGDGVEDEKEKCASLETEKSPSSPSSSTSCSHSIPLNN